MSTATYAVTVRVFVEATHPDEACTIAERALAGRAHALDNLRAVKACSKCWRPIPLVRQQLADDEPERCSRCGDS